MPQQEKEIRRVFLTVAKKGESNEDSHAKILRKARLDIVKRWLNQQHTALPKFRATQTEVKEKLDT